MVSKSSHQDVFHKKEAGFKVGKCGSSKKKRWVSIIKIKDVIKKFSEKLTHSLFFIRTIS